MPGSNLSFTDITAPFDGRIQQTREYPGALVDAYRDVLTTLVQVDPVYVIFNLTRRQLYEIQTQQLAAPHFAATARVQVLLPSGEPYAKDGKIDFVSARIDPTTDSLTVRAVVPNDFSHGAEGPLVPGQYVPARLILGEADALVIPKAALMQTQGGDQVLVVGADDKVATRKVELGPAHGDQWVIKSGLEAGERVIVEGQQKAKPGATVAPKPLPAKAA